MRIIMEKAIIAIIKAKINSVFIQCTVYGVGGGLSSGGLLKKSQYHVDSENYILYNEMAFCSALKLNSRWVKAQFRPLNETKVITNHQPNLIC
jgi:hypothetical protein